MATGHTASHRLMKHLECPICMEKFNIPRSLPKCLHSFCHKCLVGYLDNAVNYSNHDYRCPVCRDVIDINFHLRSDAISAWVANLPLNHVIVSLLDEVSEEEKPNNHGGTKHNAKDKHVTQLCKLHHGKQLEYICNDHDTMLCDSCVAQSHRKCDNVEDFKTALKLMDDSKNQKAMEYRVETVRAGLNKSVDKAKKDVKEIEIDEKKIERQISAFKQKLQVLNSLADKFEKEILKSAKDMSKLIVKKQVDIGFGLTWLHSLEEAQRKYANRDMSALDRLKAQQSLMATISQCKRFISSETSVTSPVLSLEINSSLDNLLKDGFGKLQGSGVNVQDTCMQTSATANRKRKGEPSTAAIDMEQRNAYPEPVPGPSRPADTDSVDSTQEDSHSDITDDAVSEHCDIPIIEVSSAVRVEVPNSKVPHYTGVTYLPDNRLVLADSFHKRLVLLDQRFSFQSYLDVGPEKKPFNVVYIGSNEVVASLMDDNDEEDQLLLVEVVGKQLEGQCYIPICRFELQSVASLDHGQLMLSTRNNHGNYCLSEMLLPEDDLPTSNTYKRKLLHVNGQKLDCINGFAVDNICYEYGDLPQIYVHRGCESCNYYRLICTNMDGDEIFVYSDEDLVPSSQASIGIDRRGNVYLCNRRNIHVVSTDGKEITAFDGEYDDILAMAFNQRKDKFIITHNAWNDRTIIQEYNVTF